MPDIVRSWSARDQELQPIRTVLNPQSDLCISSAPEGHKGAGAVSLKTHIAAFSTGGSSQILSKGTRMKSGSAASFNPRRRCSASEELKDGPNSLRFQKPLRLRQRPAGRSARFAAPRASLRNGKTGSWEKRKEKREEDFCVCGGLLEGTQVKKLPGPHLGPVVDDIPQLAAESGPVQGEVLP